ncbi:MAG: type II toxin-antitoxin system CcdA family antitoxin [Rhodospirillales bacterium]|nr:type II toxin-antitoxin system CcdA family antitoxin [Rhodospirillales bacterium]
MSYGDKKRLSEKFSDIAQDSPKKLTGSYSKRSRLPEVAIQTKPVYWRKENAAALESSNKWVEENCLHLDEYRKF